MVLFDAVITWFQRSHIKVREAKDIRSMIYIANLSGEDLWFNGFVSQRSTEILYSIGTLSSMSEQRGAVSSSVVALQWITWAAVTGLISYSATNQRTDCISDNGGHVLWHRGQQLLEIADYGESVRILVYAVKVVVRLIQHRIETLVQLEFDKKVSRLLVHMSWQEAMIVVLRLQLLQRQILLKRHSRHISNSQANRQVFL